MKIADIRAKSADELKNELLNLRKEQFNFRFQKATGQMENTGRIRQVRRDIARIKTALAELKQGKVPAGKPAAKKAAKALAKKTAAKKKED